MFIRDIINKYRLIKAKKNVRSNSVMEGDGHVIGPFSNILLQDNAQKEQVILKKSAWMLGLIIVQHKGVVIMHEYSKIDSTTQILCVNRVEIGAYTAIAHNTIICDNNNHPISPAYRKEMRPTPVGHDMRMWRHSANAPIIIGENCWIGTNVRICKGVTIGDNSVIAANSVVTKDIPANCIAAGNPARIVKYNIDADDAK